MEEKDIEQKSELILSEGSKLQVVDSQTYAIAAAYLKKIAVVEKEVKTYWKPLKDNAHEAWTSIKAKEKELLEPLGVTKSHIKSTMSDYLLIQEDEKKQAEKEANAVAEKYGVEVVLPSNAEKVQGTAIMDSYNIDDIDPVLLPKEINGIIIVKPDESAIKKLIKLSKGTIVIPGVRYTHSKTVKATGK